MAGGFGVMRLDPGNLGFERGDALQQLVLRISVEAFLRQQTGGIAARAREILCVHCGAASQRAAIAVNTPGG